MNEFYTNELKALKRSGRFRERKLYDDALLDAASNDYLGLAHLKELHEKACKRLSLETIHAPKASMLVNGYHHIHQEFEKALCDANGFESAIIMGSGFNANIGLIESLVRKGDLLLMDEEYHASGIAGARMCEGKVEFFTHNDSVDLENRIKNSQAKRIIVAVEGIYSMSGDLLSKEIIALCQHYGVLLVLDEAHSSGVIGENLMGILDHYSIEPEPNMIKMGTLGKAYGSFGAYVLCSKHIEEYLINRAKNVIYATAPSLYDTLLGYYALEYILQNTQQLKQQIKNHQAIVQDILGLKIEGLIVPIEIGDNNTVMEIQNSLKEELGVWVGAIRQPTVKQAIIRLIARLNLSEEQLRKICKRISTLWVK